MVGEQSESGREGWVRRGNVAKKRRGKMKRDGGASAEANSTPGAHGIKIPSCCRVLCVLCNFLVNPTVPSFAYSLSRA